MHTHWLDRDVTDLPAIQVHMMLKWLSSKYGQVRYKNDEEQNMGNELGTRQPSIYLKAVDTIDNY